MTPDGRRVVSASSDRTLKVWDFVSGACLLTHRANADYVAVAATATAIIAGDAAGSIWFLSWPLSMSQAPAATALTTTNTANRRGAGSIIAVVRQFVTAVLALVNRAMGR